MVLLAKVLGTGIGFASEAIHKAREGKSKEGSSSDQGQAPNEQAASSSSSQLPPPPHYESQPPQYYAELADEDSLQAMSHNQRYQFSQYGQNEKDFGGSVNEAEIHQDALTQDEAVWELDEASETMRAEQEDDLTPTASESEEEKIKKREAMVRNLVAMAGPASQPARRLPCPVIIPQRRPRKKERGFVRAYAPVLQDCGISQEVFIQLLNDFDVANKASKWLEVTFVAAGIVGFVPSVAAQVTSAVVQVVAGTAKELQGRHRGNTFLDRVNQELLMPRGLFGMVMAFKDTVPGQQFGPLGQLSSTIQQTFFTSERLSIDDTVAKHANPDPNMSKFKKGLNDIRLTSGKTYGDVELPASAPLVYPELDRAAKTLTAEGGSEAQKSGVIDKFKNAGEWTADYLDRRAHVFYEAEHPGTSLAVSAESQKPMKSRFNDPNHPANSGSLISVLTGGYIAAPSPLDRMGGRGGRDGRGLLGRGRGGGIGFGGLSRALQGSGPEAQQPQRSTPNRGSGGLLKKVFQKDVLYFLVVNLPTDEELQQSVHDLEQIMSQAGAAGPSR